VSIRSDNSVLTALVEQYDRVTPLGWVAALVPLGLPGGGFDRISPMRLITANIGRTHGESNLGPVAPCKFEIIV